MHISKSIYRFTVKERILMLNLENRNVTLKYHLAMHGHIYVHQNLRSTFLKILSNIIFF